MTDVAISIKNLSKKYARAKELALDHVSFEINTGDFFGLLGPNGSGKTTLLSIATGLIPATTGSVETASKADIALVPQQIALYSKLTLTENLKLFARLYKIPSQKIKERIDYCLAVTELEAVANKQIATYSGGMKRRANLAVGLVHHPKVLLLDEPTANVDPHARNLIFESLKKMNEAGMTILYTTHYLEEVEMLCQKVAILDYGRLIENDTVSNLLRKYEDSKTLADLFLTLTGRQLRD